MGRERRENASIIPRLTSTTNSGLMERYKENGATRVKRKRNVGFEVLVDGIPGLYNELF